MRAPGSTSNPRTTCASPRLSVRRKSSGLSSRSSGLHDSTAPVGVVRVGRRIESVDGLNIGVAIRRHVAIASARILSRNAEPVRRARCDGRLTQTEPPHDFLDVDRRGPRCPPRCSRRSPEASAAPQRSRLLTPRVIGLPHLLVADRSTRSGVGESPFNRPGEHQLPKQVLVRAVVGLFLDQLMEPLLGRFGSVVASEGAGFPAARRVAIQPGSAGVRAGIRPGHCACRGRSDADQLR